MSVELEMVVEVRAYEEQPVREVPGISGGEKGGHCSMLYGSTRTSRSSVKTRGALNRKRKLRRTLLCRAVHGTKICSVPSPVLFQTYGTERILAGSPVPGNRSEVDINSNGVRYGSIYSGLNERGGIHGFC